MQLQVKCRVALCVRFQALPVAGRKLQLEDLASCRLCAFLAGCRLQPLQVAFLAGCIPCRLHVKGVACVLVAGCRLEVAEQVVYRLVGPKPSTFFFA